MSRGISEAIDGAMPERVSTNAAIDARAIMRSLGVFVVGAICKQSTECRWAIVAASRGIRRAV
jgi:hypothetical protein